MLRRTGTASVATTIPRSSVVVTAFGTTPLARAVTTASATLTACASASYSTDIL